MNVATTQRSMGGRSRAQPCAFCGLPTSSKSYGLPALEVRDSQSRLLERQGAGSWPVCSDCDVLVSDRDAAGLSARVVPLLASRAARPLSAAEEAHLNARHQAFVVALPPHQPQDAP
jgi:hypothetical protein